MDGINRVHGGNPAFFAEAFDISADGIIDFSASINPLGPSRYAEEAIREGIKGAVAAYPDPECSQLKGLLARYHGIGYSNILVGNGSTQLIYLLARALRPSKALIVEPTFSEYGNALFLAGVETHSFRLSEKDGFLLNLEDLIEDTPEDCEMIFLANPSNPSGSLIHRDVIRDIKTFTEKRGMWLVLDEAFVDFCEDGSFKRDAVRAERCVVLRSMTKFFSLAGLRLGYIIGNESVIEGVEPFLEPWSVNALAQLAAAESLKDTGFIEDSLLWLEKEKGYIIKELSAIKWLKLYPASANFLLIKILEKKLTAKELQKRLLLEGSMLVRDCSSFAGLDDSFFRVSVLKREYNKRLVIGVKSIFLTRCF